MTKIIDKTILIELAPPKGKMISRLFLHYGSSMGWFAEFWMKQTLMGMPERFVFTKNMVFLAPFTFLQIQKHIPKEEFFAGDEKFRIAMAGELKEKDFIEMKMKCHRANDRVSGLNMEFLPYDAMLSLFSDAFDKTPTDLLISSLARKVIHND